MTYRPPLFLTICLLIGTFGSLAQIDSANAAERPNILFIYTDDQAPWALGASGNPECHTPTLDRLFSEGAMMTRSFTVTPVCSPSRASLMTSRYGTELAITDWINPRKEPEIGLDPKTVTWPELLQESGYRTGLIGKWHLGTADRFHPTKTGFDVFRGFRDGGRPVTNPVLEIDGATREEKGLTVDILTEYAVGFLEEQKGQKGQFLLCMHFRSPHAAWLPVADEDWAPYADLDPTLPHPDYPDLDVEKVKKKMREYMASVSGVDRSVARILKTLEAIGAGDNTVVVFTSDHGYNMGHNGIWHKGNGHWITKTAATLPRGDPGRSRPNLYDNSLLVPTAVRWPGAVKAGTKVDRTVSNLDWYPTLLEIAGAKLPEGEIIRGRSIVSLLKGEEPSTEWDDDFYSQYSQHHYMQTKMRSYRTPEWKLVRDFGREGKDELYNLKEDPGETDNLIDCSPHKEVQEELHEKLVAKMKEIDDPALEE